MGGRKSGDASSAAGRKAITCPRGVTVRQFKTEERFQVAFSYRGIECRELLPPRPITQTNATLAGGLRAEIRRKIDEGTFIYSDYFPDSPRAGQFDSGGARIMMSKLLAQQLEAYERQVTNKTLSPSTFDGYRKAIQSERMKFWHSYALREVTPSRLRDWISALGVTAKFARNLLTPLRSVMEDALNDQLITFNPFDRIALDKLLRQSSKASDYEVDPFTADERAALLKAARPDERPLIQFDFATGLRPGELMALRWNRIDWIGNTARIDLNLVSRTEKSPKTDAGIRDVDLTADALQALASQKALGFQADGRVFKNPRTGDDWETDSQVRKTLWVPLCARAGVRYRNPYQMRHTFASSLLTAGTNPWYVAQQLGHVDVQMVFQIYGKFIPQDYQKPKVTALKRVA